MKLRLKPGREKSLLRRHPWVFSGAIGALSGSPASGDTVEVCAADGRFLAWAAYSPQSQIRARVWSFDERDRPGPELLCSRIEQALALRRALAPQDATRQTRQDAALRLVHGEADRLTGFIVDR